ncbi:protein of unknown function [Lutibacter oricola]|uniref:DUF4437 domain-containing protein n=1 Tax=Lutibacter oricola TaxID=762486 RepID=A0A1H2XH51_9FLAO|nr:DUF4437 domain-containing protein [Lutibacter oricola]SDW92212.1 protein of unknown function [Lutibacter oricola]
MKRAIFTVVIMSTLVFLTSCETKVKVQKEKDSNTIENKIPKSINNPTTKVVLASEVDWSYLNPKRKDKAPMAGTLWGDRKGTEATGFLLKPKDGFSSPPHIHNVSYRGIVISGLIHNDDPAAANMWMPSGSFWTQPKGHVHITSAKGVNTIAYIEIEKGPYLVLPKEEKFDSGERPVNVDKSNIVWLDASEVKWIDKAGASIAFIWGEPKTNQLNGSLIKLPAGFNGKIYTKGETFGAVVVKGAPEFLGTENKTLETGSYLSSKGEALHNISTKEEVVFYVRTNGEYNILSK